MKKHFVSTLLLCLMIVPSAFAQQPVCTSHQLQLIEKELSKYVSLSEESVKCPQLAGQYGILRLKDHDGRIRHLGIDIFSDGMKKSIGEPVCFFIERYLLELLLKSSDNDAAFINNSSGVKLFRNGAITTKAHTFACDFVSQVNASFLFSYSDNGTKGATALWSKGNQKFAINFMPTRELIFGTDKKEADDEIKNLLTSAASYSAIATNRIAIKDLQPLKDNDYLYIRRGAVYATNNFSQDSYYLREGDDGIAVFDTKYPLESMRNLSLGLVDVKNMKVNIHHHIYGDKDAEYVLPMAKLISLLMKSGKMYCGMEHADNKTLKSVVVIDYPKYKYIHMLRLSANTDFLFGNNPVIDVQLYTNLPQQNIKSLFNK